MTITWDWSNVLAVIITVMVPIVAYVVKSRTGNIVVVERKSQSSQITVSKKIQPNLKFNFKDKFINDLVLSEFIIKNEGHIVIDDFKMQIDIISKNINYIEVIPPDATIKIKYNPDIENNNTSQSISNIVISREYLNPVKKYKDDRINLAVYSDQKFNFSVIGGGKDWVIKKIDYGNIRINRHIFYSIIIFCIFIVLPFVVYFDFTFNKNHSTTIIIIEALIVSGIITIFISFLNDVFISLSKKE